MSEVATVEVVKSYARTPVGVDVHVAVALVVVIGGKRAQSVVQCPGTLLGVSVHLGLVFGVGNLVARFDLCRFGLGGVGFKSVDCCCGIDGGDLGRVGCGVAYGVGGGGDRGVCHGAAGGIVGGNDSLGYIQVSRCVSNCIIYWKANENMLPANVIDGNQLPAQKNDSAVYGRLTAATTVGYAKYVFYDNFGSFADSQKTGSDSEFFFANLEDSDFWKRIEYDTNTIWQFNAEVAPFMTLR